jgi:serine/threonine protein phosphatase PrpC
VTAPTLIDWGVAALALAGETASGDLHLVKPVGTAVLLAVVDGLGHGADAALAARAAVTALERHAGEPATQLPQRCHEVLLGKRGVVLSLALLDHAQRSMTWLGVGNVEGVLLRAHPETRPDRESLVTVPGIVGSELPRLRVTATPVSPGDTLILASDGVRSGFTDAIPRDAPPQQLADQILARHSKGTDDALVLVARYLGAGPEPV